MRSVQATAARLAAAFSADWLLCLVLAALTIVLYWPAIHLDFVSFDDPYYVTTNVHVQTGVTLANIQWAFTTGAAANWHPLTWISLMLDANMFGTKPAGFHFTNFILHAIAAVLLYCLLKQLTGARWRSACVAALFASHPVHVESVAWISERKDVLSACFAFLTLMFYTGYAHGLARQNQTAPSEPTAANAARFILPASFSYILALLCFACGLLSKPMLVTCPFVLLLLDFWPLERFERRWLGRLLWEKIPFFALSLGGSIVTFLVQRQGGAVVPEELLPVSARIANALVSYCRYVGKLIWPANLSILYTHNHAWPVTLVLGAALCLAISSVLLWLGRKRFPFAWMGWLWFLGMLVPVIGLVQVGEQAMADRYAYLPSVGLSVALVWSAFELTRRSRARTFIASLAALGALAACAAATRVQIGYWRNSETLFAHALAATEGGYTAHNNLGRICLDNGRNAEAVRHFQQAVGFRPNYAPAHSNLGVALDKLGRTDDAIAEYREAMRLDPADSSLHNNLGVILGRIGQTESGIREYREAIRLSPANADLHVNLGGLLAKSGQTLNAVAEFQEALRLNPAAALAHANLAGLLVQQGQTDAAIGEYAAVVRLQPANADARDNLGSLLLKEGRLDAAGQEFVAALQAKPDDAEAHFKLANVLVLKGHATDAVGELKETIRLRPNDATAHNNLALVFSALNEFAAATNEFGSALRLAPENAEIHFNFGNALAKAGQNAAAIRQFQEALRLKPDYPPARANLAKALALAPPTTVPK